MSWSLSINRRRKSFKLCRMYHVRERSICISNIYKYSQLCLWRENVGRALVNWICVNYSKSIRKIFPHPKIYSQKFLLHHPNFQMGNLNRWEEFQILESNFKLNQANNYDPSESSAGALVVTLVKSVKFNLKIIRSNDFSKWAYFTLLFSVWVSQ